MNRIAVLYVATLIVLTGLDFLFLGLVAKGFFTAQVGDMLGELKPVPAILFYLLYVGGVLIFVSGSAGATWQSTLLYGALFGLFCYATFDLTALALLEALELAGRVRRRRLGRGSDRGLIDRGSVGGGSCDGLGLTSAAARSGCRASVPSSPAGRSSWPRRWRPSPR